MMAQYKRSPAAVKVALWLVIGSLLPLLYLVGNRLSANFDNDGGPYIVMHLVDRVFEGLPIYAPASTEHLNGGYTPLYLWLSGWLCKLFGLSFFWPRLVSVVSSVMLAFLIGAFVWKNTERNLLLSVAAPAFILWTSAASGFNVWMVDVNVNALHAALAVLGFFLLRPPLSTTKTVCAAVAMALCVLAKQTGMAYVAAGFLFVFGLSRKNAILFLAVSAGILVVVFGWLNASTNGEFYRQVVLAHQGPPWQGARLVDEVILKVFIGMAGFMTLMAVAQFLMIRAPGFWRSVWKAEYFLCAAGVGVACIAHPKLGSGALQDLVGLCGIAVCGCMGIYMLCRQMPEWAAVRWLVLIPLSQLAVVVLTGMSELPYALFDESDAAKYRQIGSVFQSGRTSVYLFPFIQRAFGQKPGGYPEGDLERWRGGRVDYSIKADDMVKPYRDQEFDYVILPAYADNEDRAVQAVVKNYVGISRIEGNPRGPRGGNMRYAFFVMKAKRLQSMVSP